MKNSLVSKVFAILVILAFFSAIGSAQTTTTNLDVPKPQVGQGQPTTTIASSFDKFDAAIAGRLSKSVAGSSDVTLTTTEARNKILEFTGTITANINVIVPTKARSYLVYNNTTGAFTLTVKTSGGTGVAVTQATRVWVYCDATNVVAVTASGGSGATTALDNLASVSINTSLLAQTGVDLGSTVKPFRNLYLFGGGTYGTNYFKFDGTPTGTRTFTLPDRTATLATSSGTLTDGNCAKFDVSGNIVDHGSACGGGGSGTVSSSSADQVPVYTASTTVGGSTDFTFTRSTSAKTLTVTSAASTALVRVSGFSTSNSGFSTTSSAHPGTGDGLFLRFVAGSQSDGPGIWWTNGSYGGLAGLWLSGGFNLQGWSSNSKLRLRKGTGTSSDGAITFELDPDGGYLQLAPFGTSAGETTQVRHLELAANGTDYFAIKAADSIATTRTMILPNADPSVGESLRVSAFSSNVITTEWGSRQITGTASLDFGATAAGTCDTLTITVTGAADGDVVMLGIPNALAASDSYQSFQGYVSAADTITVKRCNLTNLTTALSNPSAATVRASILKP